MNILLLTQYYPPEPGSASMRMGELAEYLGGRGHRVTGPSVFSHFVGGNEEAGGKDEKKPSSQ